jgi:hypothetical protein
MIKPREIQQNAIESGVRDQQIEKDYVISWILQGIAFHEKLSSIIVFKGGLENTVSNQQIYSYFKNVFEYVSEEANIEFYKNEFKNKCMMKKLNPKGT